MDDETPIGTERDSGAIAAMRLIGLGRCAFGTLFMVYPEVTSERILTTSDSNAQALTFGRMAAGRDLALGLGTLLSTWQTTGPDKGWLLGGLVADAVDFYAFLKDDSFTLTARVTSAAVAFSAVGLGAWTLKTLNGHNRGPSDLGDPDFDG